MPQRKKKKLPIRVRSLKARWKKKKSVRIKGKDGDVWVEGEER